jgi:hypothetical protein
MLWSIEQSPAFELQVNEQITVELSLQVPLYQYTRLVIQIGIGGYLADESFSEWLDT